MTTITIESNLGIDAAPELRRELLAHLPSKRDLTVSIERVDRLHSAAIQVLCAFVRDRAAANATTRIEGPVELHAAAALLGVGRLLGLTPTNGATA